MRPCNGGHVVQNRQSALSLAWHEWFSKERQRMKDLLLRARVVVRTSNVNIWQTSSKCCTKKRASRAAQLFVFIQPINLRIDLWRCRCRSRRHFLNSQLNRRTATWNPFFTGKRFAHCLPFELRIALSRGFERKKVTRLIKLTGNNL